MLRAIPGVFLTAITFAFLLGCAVGQASTPLSPDLKPDGQAQTVSGQYLWGFWDVSLDRETGEFHCVPLRACTFQANVTRFLQPPASPVHLLTVELLPGTDIAAGLVVCNVTLRHPFPGHPRFRGFDVRGIVMGDASRPGLAGDGELWPRQDEFRVLNADGYTRWWNPTEFTTYEKIFGYTHGAKAPAGYLASGTLNGYKYFADDLDSDEPIGEMDLSQRGSFGADPGVNSRRYELRFPVTGAVPDLRFNYAITASYFGPTTDEFPDYPIEVFPISANTAEAFRLDIISTGSTAYYESPTTYGGDLNLEIHVFDWGFLKTSVVTDEITEITLESETLFPGQETVDLTTGSPGATGCSWVFDTEIPDVSPTSVNGQEILLRVLSTQPSTYAPDIPGVGGFDYPQNAPLCAYLVWEAPILPHGPGQNQPPEVGAIDGPDHLFINEDGLYTLSYATDPEDGTNLTILWDNDGDLDFADDLDGDSTNLEALLNFPTKGFQYVIARAVDSGGLHTDSAPYEVYIEACPTEVHHNFSSCQITDGVGDYYCRMAAAYQTVGDYAGWVMFQNRPGEISIYDTSQPSPWTGIPFISLVGTVDIEDKVFSMDCCDFSGRVALSIMNPDDVRDPSLFSVYDVDGSHLETFSVGQHREVCAIDTDDNGDLWVATWENWHDDNDNHEIDPGEGATSQFQHYIFQEDAPYYIEDTGNECDTTDQFPGNNQMWDLAISYTLDRIYAIRASYSIPDPWAPYGEIYCWDITPDGALAFNEAIQNLAPFPTEIRGSYTAWHGSIVGGEIEIDHSFERSEYCRILIMGKKKPAAGDWGHYFIAMDADLNQLAISEVLDQDHRYMFALRTDKYPFNREIITPSFNNTNEIHIAPAPPGW